MKEIEYLMPDGKVLVVWGDGCLRVFDSMQHYEDPDDRPRLIVPPLQETGDKDMPKKFIIKVLHSAEVEYTVPAESFREALEKLCDKQIWVEMGHGRVGVDDRACERLGIAHTDPEPWGDPTATGQGHYSRDWEYEVEGEENDG